MLYIIVVGLLLLAAIAFLLREPTEAEVQVSFPKNLKLLNNSTNYGEGVTRLNLPIGISVLRFERNKELLASVVNVVGGGDIYLAIEEKDIVPVLVAEELR
jgi:hypothetical protein